MAVKQKPATNIVGAHELVGFPAFNLHNIKAKIDTGADTGALHCTQIREVKEDGKRVLHFSPFDHPHLEFSTQDFTTKSVRSSNGHAQDRYFIRTRIIIAGAEHTIRLSLADRSEMTWPVLIGRKFLRRHHLLVDVRQGVRV